MDSLGIPSDFSRSRTASSLGVDDLLYPLNSGSREESPILHPGVDDPNPSRGRLPSTGRPTTRGSSVSRPRTRQSQVSSKSRSSSRKATSRSHRSKSSGPSVPWQEPSVKPAGLDAYVKSPTPTTKKVKLKKILKPLYKADGHIAAGRQAQEALLQCVNLSNMSDRSPLVTVHKGREPTSVVLQLPLPAYWPDGRLRVRWGPGSGNDVPPLVEVRALDVKGSSTFYYQAPNSVRGLLMGESVRKAQFVLVEFITEDTKVAREREAEVLNDRDLLTTLNQLKVIEKDLRFMKARNIDAARACDT